MSENELNRREVFARTLPIVGAAGAIFAGGGIAQSVLGAAADAANPVAASFAASYKDGVYTLPPLPYAYDALEPSIDAETMKLHHDKHHQAYVDGLNKTLKSLADLRKEKEINNALLTGLEEDLSFNGSGHILHSLFWAIMTPKGGTASGAIATAIEKNFGSVEAFQNQFSKTAASVKGSGWAILAYEPLGDALIILQVKQHDLQTIFGCVPLLPLDVWEHAYYKKYSNVRADYIKAWWNVVNWDAVDKLYVATRKAHGRV